MKVGEERFLKKTHGSGRKLHTESFHLTVWGGLRGTGAGQLLQLHLHRGGDGAAAAAAAAWPTLP